MMPIYMDRPAPFNCAICHTEGPRRWESPDMQSIPPLCWRCEQEWGVGQYGDRNPDRRIAKQIRALAEALTVEAHRAEIGERPMYARA
jgi:hypothetical protein